MVFSGELVIVLNSPASEEEALQFSRSVFEFPSATLVLAAMPPSMKRTLERINKEAGELGRSVLTAPDWAATQELFNPEKVFYFDHKNKRPFDSAKITEPLKTDKTVSIVFGSSPGKDAEKIGLRASLQLHSAASIVLYSVEEGMNPAGPMQG